MLRSLYLKYKLRTSNSYDRCNYLRKLGIKIGEGCCIHHDVSFGTEPYLIEIGDNVRIVNKVTLNCHDGSVWVLRHLYSEMKDIDRFGRIKIGNNVNIGYRAMIMPGVTIGNNVVIGAYSVVTRDIPDNSVAVGIPARVIETIDEYKKKHESEFVHTKHMNSSEKRDFILKNIK